MHIITLANTRKKRNVLRNAKSLQNKAKYKKMYIVLDFTNKPREKG